MNIASVIWRARRVLPFLFTLTFVAFTLSSSSCASTSVANAEPGQAGDARYPRRPPGCELAVYETAVPGVVAWDDLGVAEAACHINDPVAECLRRLKAEACQMGGDILYNVPRKPLRPRDQVLVYRAQVAHTRKAALQKPDDPDMPPPASAEESAGPVVPLPSADAPSVGAPVATTTASTSTSTAPHLAAPAPVPARAAPAREKRREETAPTGPGGPP